MELLLSITLFAGFGAAFVWIKRGQTFQRQAVKLAGMNDVEAAVASGVAAGDVVLRNPRAQKGGAS